MVILGGLWGDRRGNGLVNMGKLYLLLKICGKIKKGHTCPGKRVKLVPLEKKCKLCFQVKKGHICSGIKKNLLLSML